MNLLDLSGKTILITGGACAIGRGAIVAVNDIVPAAQVQSSLPNRVCLRRL